MRVLRWLARHWYLPVIAIASVAAILFAGSRRSPRKAIQDELHAIDQGEKARLLDIDFGFKAANAEIDGKYARQIKELDDAKARKAERLRGDPAARVRFLQRLVDREGG